MPAIASFSELAAMSNFSFLEGASHPEEIVARAAQLGMPAVAIADRHTMAGVVRAHVAAKEHGVQLVVGTRCTFALGLDGEPTHLELVLLAESVDGYARLCRLLTLGKRRAGWTLDVDANAHAVEAGIETRESARNSSTCHLWLHDLLDASVQSLGSGEPGEGGARVPGADRPLAPFALPGVQAIVMPPDGYGAMHARFLESLRWLRTVFDDDRLSLGFVRRSGPDDALRLLQLEWLAQETGIPLVASNDPRCHVRTRQPLQDVLTAIRAGRTVEELRGFERTHAVDAAHGCAWAGPRLMPDDARHLVGADGMRAVFPDVPEAVRAAAIARAAHVAARCAGFSMSMLRYRYPREVSPPGVAPIDHLRALVEQGAAERWPAAAGGVPTKVRTLLEHELSIIRDLDYPCYFLTVHAVVAFARGQGILCQGRGAAANSAVCFCLGITAVDPTRSDMLFERFISRERDEPPDIDVDFEHERREEVIQFIYRTWGRSRAALCAEVICFRGRSAVREAAKAFGVDPAEAQAVAERMADSPAGTDAASRARAALIEAVLCTAKELEGFPRHLSQHVGGFIVTDGPLCELVPVRNARMDARTIVEWDKDDAEAMGMLKMDILALGMLTAIRKAIDLGNAHPSPGWPRGAEGSIRGALAYRTVPPEDAETYAMVSRADTVGVFQIESRAQMSMLPRLRPRCFYDLVIEVAIVRPGPIQGDMVHPYLRRRDGTEPTEYPNEAIRTVLGKTLGVPLFQEQAMALAVVAAGFTPGEADQLRRAIAAWKRSGNQIARFGEKLIGGMRARGYGQRFAEQVFGQIQGFSGYGFPESHAASFAMLVYVSAWLKRHHPAAFTAALLNSQPMGFYAPAQLVRDAREHGVEVRPVDVLRSQWDCSLEDAASPALRLGLRMVSGLREEDGRAVVDAARAHGTFTSVEAIWRASGCSLHALRRLAAADAFAAMGVPRQQALWQVRALRDGDAPVLDEAAEQGATLFDMSPQPLPAVPPLQSVAADYAGAGLSLRDHPIRFLRESLARRGAVPCAALRAIGEGRTPRPSASVAGLVLCRQRPSTASGIVFMTLEDESGIANLIIRPKTYERIRRIARGAMAVLAEGTVEHRSGVTHLVVRRMTDLGGELAALAGGAIPQQSRDFR
jgi:error-prone DNA polymerase